MPTTKVRKIISGGQTGADRAALNFAIENRVKCGGWCPRGGWAEDFPVPPGLLQSYGFMKETPSSDIKQRTIWNIRDSDMTLVIVDSKHGPSKGTDFTIHAAADMQRPVVVFDLGDYETSKNKLEKIFEELHREIILNVAGPRESEQPGIYERASEVLRRHVLKKIA